MTLKDHISTISLLKKYKLPSVNQLAAEIKLVKAWKIMNIPSYPLQLEDNNPNKQPNQRSIRPSSIKLWKDIAKLICAQESFTIDTARLWNRVPTTISSAQSLQIAKTSIKKTLQRNGYLIFHIIYNNICVNYYFSYLLILLVYKSIHA